MSRDFYLSEVTTADVLELRNRTGTSANGAQFQLALEKFENAVDRAQDIDDMKMLLLEIARLLRTPSI